MKLYRYNEESTEPYPCDRYEEVEVIEMRSIGSSVNDPWFITAVEDHTDGLLVITAKHLLPSESKNVGLS